MKTAKLQVLAWSIGLCMPLWLVVAALVIERFASIHISGAWLYVGVILAAATCAIVVAFSRFAVWQRIALVFASWLLIIGEVFSLGVLGLSRSGFAGVQ